MASPDSADPFDTSAQSESAVGSNLGLLEDAAKSIRRMEADEDYNEGGVRTIWHRGRLRTELLSWEDRDGKILKQELSIYGMILEYEKGAILRTGNIPINDETTGSGKPMAHLIEMDESPSQVVLEYASHLLKHVPGRDFYSQHLLKHVNDTISLMGMDASRTAVSASLRGFSKEKKNIPTMKIEEKKGQAGEGKRKGSSGNSKLIIAAVLLALLGIGAGAAVGFLIK